jgi:hypothetical protein
MQKDLDNKEIINVKNLTFQNTRNFAKSWQHMPVQLGCNIKAQDAL